MESRKKKVSPILTVKWNLTKQQKGVPVERLYSGNGIRLLDSHGRRTLRWWSVTLDITSKNTDNEEDLLKKEKVTFRPATKLTFDELMANAANYVESHFSEEYVSLMTDVIVLAAVCKAQPKT
jgi:hypothetical protein